MPDELVDWFTCTCCGKGIRDNAEENVSHGQTPYPHDVGFGLCRECGGDNKVKGTDIESVRRRLGWAAATFYDARIDMLLKPGTLNDANRDRFARLSYVRKIAVIQGLVEKGTII